MGRTQETSIANVSLLHRLFSLRPRPGACSVEDDLAAHRFLEAAWRLYELRAHDRYRAELEHIETILQGEPIARVRRSRRTRGKTRPRHVQLCNGVEAIFKHENAAHEVAAYRLDKLLELNIVPVTVERAVEGVCGSLQYLLKGATTVKQTLKQGRRSDPPTNRDDVAFFHYLIQNADGWAPSNLLVTDSSRYAAVDHGDGFPAHEPGTVSCSPAIAYLGQQPSARAYERLVAIGEEQVSGALAEVLNPSQIHGLLARRKIILESRE